MRDVGNNSLTCGHCGVTHDTLAPASHHTDPLCYRYPSAAGDVRVEVPEDERATGAVLTRVSLEQAPQARGRDRGGGGASGSLSGTERCLPTALLLPVPSGPTSCASCGAYLRLENIVGICLSCNHCNNHLSGSFTACRSELELTLRLKLKAMLDIARRATRGSLLCSDALKMLCSLTAALQRADETHLPWRGCDLSKDMMCGVSPRMPVFEDETVHGAVSDVAEILQSICVIAGTMASGDAVEATATETSWARKRPWISVALDLVDLMNRTTDYDELGFDVLARLCEVIRPSQRAHIYRETRWAYLRHMKLPREWIVNDVVCSTCLLTNRTFSPDSVVEGVCRCAESPGTAATYAIGTHRETAADKKMA
uniref:Uncharacterized protein TCIL3000_2_1110 n=1 Tax=Trypanosoma congolense (strain IL3000) TaxID=1068625 RepID=G0UJI0_TRYCI|nr:unnamed protein product [Trypanosoma congolense IL3000]